jgi:hypothetical protein
MASFNPTQIFDDGTTEEKGENARLSAFVGAIAVGDLGMRSFHLDSSQESTECSQELIKCSENNPWALRHGQDIAVCFYGRDYGHKRWSYNPQVDRPR